MVYEHVQHLLAILPLRPSWDIAEEGPPSVRVIADVENHLVKDQNSTRLSPYPDLRQNRNVVRYVPTREHALVK